MIEPRIEQWKRKLLDISLRNPLLNTRDTQRFLPLQKGDVFGRASGPEAVAPYIPPEVGEAMPFRFDLPGKETGSRLKELYRTSRSRYEDTGVNQLFVVVGFLHWNERDGGEFRRAPLTLVPAWLERAKTASGYGISRTDEGAVVNFCLLELLRSQFKIPVKDVKGGGTNDGDPDYLGVYAEFADAVKQKREWYITTDVALGIFAFDKIVIWKDLADHEPVFRGNPFFNHLADRRGIFDDGIKVFPPEEVESHVLPSRFHCPLSADASQMTAVMYSALGKSFVLHGPPGTGKSQTITNIIAHNLALGRRVLFVSEKKAALDVVYRRLESIGLSPFCLELHSNKSRKVNVMQQFQAALEVAKGRNPAHWDATCADMASSMWSLAGFVRELHRPSANGRTCYTCIDRLSGKHPASSSALVPAGVVAMSADEVDGLVSEANSLGEEWKGVDAESFRALKPLKTFAWSPAEESGLTLKLDALIAAAESADSFFGRLAAMLKALTVKSRVSLPLFAKPATWIPALNDAKAHLDGLRLVMSYRFRADAFRNRGCAPFVTALEDGRFTYADAERVFEESVCERTLDTIIAKHEGLSSFSGLRQEEKIAHFREIDARYSDSVRKFIVAKLSKSMPDSEALDPDGRRRLAVIKRESAKKRRVMAIRELLADTMPVALKLKPCFLMSPLSVAQYLPAGTDLFDLVVFDEASQMTVWDAVATIARGRQLICVGDPKQLPPSSFFVRGDSEDDDPDVQAADADMESILDECLANGLLSAHLNWHYRSRHESLIAFSNRHYYEDRLNTFPAAESSDRLGVSFRFVDGAVYEHATHTNRGEAQALVDFLYERLQRDPSERKRSWGIVTFSVSQQRLIERMLEERFEGVPWAGDFFSESNPDAFFVKNLENVQGDERDVIIFSIAYAPDAKGNFAMSFGPVNLAGGERRLNVAITRAREQVVVFSSVHSSAIRAERTNSVGVKHLKALMQYAETGMLEGDAPRDPGARASGIVAGVRSFLESKGYVVEERVGRSSMPVDLAVRDPADANRYALAIEFDGPSYAAQRTVRDRDVLRPSVLERLGWRHFRLWSVDWKYDRKRIQERLLAALAGSSPSSVAEQA